MAGKRVNLADLATVPVQETRLPGFLTPKTSLPVDDIAPNPCNRRRHMRGIEELASSMTTIGQNTPCAIVTRAAFLGIFPEHEGKIGAHPYVAVTGRRRQLAAQHAGIPLLEVTVRDEFAESRGRFLAVTASENIDRESFDPIEEAGAVQDLVAECGSNRAAAAQLSKSEGWVSQRLALLRLVPALQELVSSGEMPIRVARDLGALDRSAQEQAWASFQATNAEPEPVTAGGPPASPSVSAAKPAKTRKDPAEAAIHRLGATPEKIATALRKHLSTDDLAELVHLLRS